jgi:dTDP-4-dehydrorhamnose reductase
MKLLVIGANGQVGGELLRSLAPLGDIVATTRDGTLPADVATATPVRCIAADLADPASLAHALDDASADIIVNAAAYTAVDRAESERELADRVNHVAVGEIGAWAKRRSAGVVHYSTDYVFAGDATHPYRESDPTSPLGAYGKTKLDGENALRASGARHLIVRTAWVYASRGHNFLRTMLRLGAERETLRVVADQTGAPTPAKLIADTTAAMIGAWHESVATGDERYDGTYHLVSRGETSWHGFAEAIFAGAVERGLIARAPRVEAIATADYPTPARRPAYSVLDVSRLETAFGLQLPDWRAGLDVVLDELAR